MLFYIVTFALLHAATAFPSKPLEDGNCKDVLFACRDIQTAQSCKAVIPCIHIWEKVKVPEDNNEICDLCKEMVKEARDQLLSNETQEELKEVFEGSCRLIPIKEIAKECISVVDQLIPTLIESLASRMDPDQVCTVAGLCNNGQLVSIMKTQISELAPALLRAFTGKSDKCTECQSSMGFLKKLLKFIGSDALSNLQWITLNACITEFHGTTAECEVIVKDVVPIVFHYLKSVNPSTFCGAMKSCPLKYPLPKPLGDNLTCEFCEALVQYTHTIFGSATTKEEFKTAFTNMCKDIRKFSSECSSLVSKYFDTFYDFVVKQMDGPLVCTALGLCGDSSNPVKMVKTFPAIDIYPAVAVAKQATRIGVRVMEPVTTTQYKHRPGINIRLPESSFKTNRVPTESDIETNEIEEEESQEVGQLSPERFLHPSIISQNDLVCTVCKTVIQYLDDALKDNKTEDEIRNLLDNVCSYFPQELSDQCQDFVNQYTAMIVNLIIEQVNPDQICVMLKVCPGQQPQQLPPERFLHPSIISQNDLACTVCKTVIQYVDDALKDKKSEDEIRKLLDSVCSYLPQKLSDQCKDFVDEYTDMIVNLIIQEVNPDQICAMLRVCPEGTSIKAIPVLPKGVMCEVCVKVMQYIEKELEDNSTEEAIRKALDKACSLLPSSYSTKCQQFMDQYSEMIFELLSKEVAPRMICSFIGICPFGSQSKPNGEIECQICQYTLHFIQGRLMDNATEAEIKEALENACQELPEKLATECKNYIEQYGDQILALIAQEIDPSVICVKLDICPAFGIQPTPSNPVMDIKDLKIDTCGTCEIVVDYMDKLLENDDVDREIVKLVEKVCAIVPQSTREQCQTMIEAYGPYILQMIGQLADSKEVCQTIDLCARTPGHVHLVGGEKCTFGPTYWCQSSTHATACKAETYCKEKVW